MVWFPSPQDAFRVVDGVLHRTLLSVTSTAEVTDPSDPDLIRKLQAVWSHEPVADGDAAAEDPDVDAIIRQYASRHQVSHVPLPPLLWRVGARCLLTPLCPCARVSSSSSLLLRPHVPL